MMDAPFPPFAPVTPEEAAEHCAVLDAELTEYLSSRRALLRERRALAAATPAVAARVVRLRAAEYEPGVTDLSDGAGLTPADRAALMAAAKARAIEFAVAVRSENAQLVQRLSAGMTQELWKALAITFAAAADPSRLLIVVQAADDGMPAHLSPEGRTRAA